MAQIHIVLDSTAHVERDFFELHDCLHIASLTVRIGQAEYAETELGTQEFFSLVAQDPLSKQMLGTSQPAVGNLAELFSKLTANGSSVIMICLSGALSGTVQGAYAAAQMVGGDIHIIDSRTTAVGLVKLAEQALQWIRLGLDAAAVTARLDRSIAQTHTYFVPGTLEYLQRGGRIGKAAGLVGTLLKIRPVLYLVEGTVHVLDKVRTQNRAIQRMLEEIQQRPNYEYLGIVHLEAPEQARDLAIKLQALYPEVPVSVSTVGSVLACHLGPGLVGVICQEGS